MKHTLTITTDFGDSFSTSQLHAVIDSFGFTGRVIENHSTAQFSIKSGAFEILLLSKFTKPGTVHLGVIDPGVGSERAGIAIKTKNFWFVGPDNGLLYPASNEDKIEEVWRLNEGFFPDVTKTFHGRDVFIKSALYLAMGKPPEKFGCTKFSGEIIPLDFDKGEILHIDAYGNLKVYWPEKLRVGDKLRIGKNGSSFEVPVVHTFDDVKINEPLAYEGSSRTLELAINQANFAEKFNIENNQILEIEQI